MVQRMRNLNFRGLQSKFEMVQKEYAQKFEANNKVEIRFTMNKDEIEESLPNVHWVWLDLGVLDGNSNV